MQTDGQQHKASKAIEARFGVSGTAASIEKEWYFYVVLRNAPQLNEAQRRKAEGLLHDTVIEYFGGVEAAGVECGVVQRDRAVPLRGAETPCPERTESRRHDAIP